MTSLVWHLRFELTVLRRSRWLLWLLLGLLSVTVGMTLIVGLSLDTYYAPDERLRWASLLTQGGVLGWPPLFAFFLALLGVLSWGQDCGGESAYVTYSSFPDRWRTGLVRGFLLTFLSSGVSLVVVAIAAGMGLLWFGLEGSSANLELAAVKAVWMVTCGVTFAHLGALLCVLSRSALLAAGLLLVIPWVVEPVLIELANLASGLSWLGPPLRFLPFRVAGDAVGDPTFEVGGWGTGGQLPPSAAAITASTYALVAAVVVHVRYCRADAQ